MNSKELKEKLLEKVPVGTEYDIYSVGFASVEIVVQETHKHINFKHQKNEVKVMYKSNTLATISVSRKKGDYHPSMFYGYYEWFVKGYGVYIVGEKTIEDRIKDIDNLLNKIENARVIELNKMVDTTKKIMALGLTKKDITEYAQYMVGYVRGSEVWDKIEKGE